METRMPYIPGVEGSKSELLWRFLPPLPEGIISKWLEMNIDKGSWLLDPFGYSPSMILEAARSGYKVLVSANNPIARFLIELAANPADEAAVQAALAELAYSRIGEERLDSHLQGLYRTTCSQCGMGIIARAFIWERESDAPYAKIYECNHCGDSGERPVTPGDVELARSFSAESLERMRILERIAPSSDPTRMNVEEALSVYLPRAIYGLVTLINRLDALLVASSRKEFNSQRESLLIALVLNALDECNNLWSHPSGRARPKQLTSSPRFRENNIWMVLEESIGRMINDHEQVPFMIYPQLPDGNLGIVLYEGPLRELSDQLSQLEVQEGVQLAAVFASIPRYNQAYWTLSALWTGLIWGKDSIGSFKSVLHRRRYDWSWHTMALHYAFRSMAKIMPDGIPTFSLVGEADSNFLSASLIAAHRAGFTIHGIAIRADRNLSQILWKQASNQGEAQQLTSSYLFDQDFTRLAVNEEINHLQMRGEPAVYLTLHTSALVTLIKSGGISKAENVSSADEYTRLNELIEDSLSFKNGFIRYGGSEKTPESSRFWHHKISGQTETLSDRIETRVLEFIRKSPGMHLIDLDEKICQDFPGFSTPDFGLVSACVESYCDKEQWEAGNIFLRTQDDYDKRTNELNDIENSIKELGDRLGFSSQGESPIIWQERDGANRFNFHIIASACISKIVSQRTNDPARSIIVLPGARANLILYKLHSNPALREEIDRGWRFIKFRHLRYLIKSPALNRENLDISLTLDPLTETPAQMRLL